MKEYIIYRRVPKNHWKNSSSPSWKPKSPKIVPNSKLKKLLGILNDLRLKFNIESEKDTKKIPGTHIWALDIQNTVTKIAKMIRNIQRLRLKFTMEAEKLVGNPWNPK